MTVPRILISQEFEGKKIVIHEKIRPYTKNFYFPRKCRQKSRNSHENVLNDPYSTELSGHEIYLA